MRLVSITSSVDADPGFERDISGVLGFFFCYSWIWQLVSSE